VWNESTNGPFPRYFDDDDDDDDDDHDELKNYRPITYLSTMNKMLTEIPARRVSYLEEHSLLSSDQKGCHSGSKGCTD
jgi:hypothetical protein